MSWTYGTPSSHSNYKMSKLLFLFFILFLNINNASATDKVHLVSVGIADYPGTSNDLTLPAKDAASVKWLYEKKFECGNNYTYK